MANVARVEATITAQNKLRPGLAAASRDLDRFRAAQTKAGKAFAASATQLRNMERMERVAGSLRSAVAPIAGYFALQRAGQALKEATVRFADVDRAMTRTGITGDATVQEVRKGTEELRNLARETATLFDPAQKGLDAITASGRAFGEAMKMMPSVLRTAQASGAGVEEIANSSTALLDHMKISVEGLQEAQDTLAMGGKLGKFELKDMARYLPSMLPAFKALGAEGQTGLRSLVAMLQVIRMGTGTAEEAAASANNIFAKMESDKTVKNFKDLGIDLPKQLAMARKEGRNLLEVFVDLSAQAVKGDLSKVPQLFSDMEFARGMRALLSGQEKYREYLKELGKSSGTIATDLKRVTSDAKADIDRLSEGADRAKSAFGGLAAELGSPLIKTAATNFDLLAQAMERATTAARDGGGVSGAIKSVATEFGTAVVNDLREGRQNMDDLTQKGEDEAGIARLRDEKRGGWFDWLIGDTSRGATQAALDKLLAKEKRGPLNAFERTNKKTFQDRLAADDNAWSRDQFRRLGAMPQPLTSQSPEFEGAIEAGREARRAAAFTQSSSAPGPFAAPLIKRGQAQRGRVLPPRRPAGLGAPAYPAYGDDAAGPRFRNDTAKLPQSETGNPASNSLYGSQPLATQTVDPRLSKTKTPSFSDMVGEAGSAASAAGSALATGLTPGLAAMEAQVAAAVARMQAHLNSLKAPNLSFGAGLGGFDTGKGMAEVR